VSEQSAPYLLSQAVVDAIRAEPLFSAATVLDNPTGPAALADGDRLVFVEDMDDTQLQQPNQTERRAFRFAIGVIARTEDARRQADADMQVVKRCMRVQLLAALRQLKAAGDLDQFAAPVEGPRRYRVEGVDVGGALIVTEFQVTYLLPQAR